MQQVTPEQVLDAWEAKRKVSRWRWTSVLLFIILLFSFSNGFGWFQHKSPPIYGNYIARVNIEGIITSDQAMVEHFTSLKENSNIKAVFVHVNSPGGASVGGEMLYKALRDLSESKPVIALLDDVAASAGYMIALGADRIIAHRTTVTASIGAAMYAPNFQELGEKLGVKLESYKSSPLKAQPNPMETTTPEAQQILYNLVWDSYQVFLSMVHERRGLPAEDLARIADGRIMTGHQAFAAGLLDELGGEEAAMAWLIQQGKITEKMPIYELPYAEDEVNPHTLLKSAISISKDIKAIYKMMLSHAWLQP